MALPPPRMVIFGALSQVLLVPPSGYRCFRRRPGCLASVREVFVAYCLPSSSYFMATKALGPVWGVFLYTMLPVLLGCCMNPHWGIHHRMILNPFWTPLRHVRTPSGACVSVLSLSSAASWLLSSLLLCGLCYCVCCAFAAPPLCFPNGGTFLLVGSCVVCFICWLDTEVTALLNVSVISL